MDTFQKYYDRLNKEQKQAVDKIDGPLLVLAGPGTGKTQLLSVRAANIIHQGKALPENILILTFTNAAAREMRERLAGIIGHEGYNVEVETFHSFANSIVLESEGAIKFVKDKIEISEVEKVKAIEHILDNVKGVEPLRPFGSPYIHRKEIEKRISELKNEGILPDDFKKSLKGLKPDGINLEEKHMSRLSALALIYENYEKLKDQDRKELYDERGRIDYDDMILIALDALKKNKELRQGLMEQYRYIMVDEYQDTNGAQLELLFAILDPDARNVCCVGDDDQAIYRFQGATLSNFRTLKKRLPGLETIPLKNNYRSTEDIIRLSGEIITQLPGDERIALKQLKPCMDYSDRDIRFLEFLTEEEELAYVVEEVKKQAEVIKKDKTLTPEEKKKPYNNIAVLVRKRDQILKVVDAFLKAGIPYATDGEEDIRGEKRVRQMLDVLDLASVDTESNERKSLALYKVLASDYIGASHSDILKLIGAVNRKKLFAKEKRQKENRTISLFQQFQENFPVKKDENGECVFPDPSGSKALEITRELKLEDPHALHRTAWAVERLLKDARNRPVHDLLMGYVEDTRLYRFILQRYEKEKVLRIRDLRALVSFINMVKRADLADPALGLDDFIEELELREVHGMPIQGKLATLSQDGVRVYTAHKAKGLEFYTVFMPFCLQQKSWPLRRKPDVIPLPPDIYKSKERVEEKEKIKLLDRYDELRLFYVASTRARSHLVYTATPAEKVIVSPFMGHLSIEPEEGSPKDEEKFLVDYLSKNAEDDALKNTPEVLKDIVKHLSLNPTSLNNYIKCRRKFLYDNVLMLPGRKNQHLTFGNCAHKALEEVYAEYMDKKRFPKFSFFKKSFLRELEYQGVSDAIKGWCVSKLEGLKTWYDKESESPVMPLDLENKLEISLPEGLTFRGTFDKVEEDAAGAIKVIDYKTGKPDDHIKAIANCRDLSKYECDDYYRQLVAYKLLYERADSRNKKGTVARGVLQFLEPVASSVKKYGLEKGSYRNETVELNDDLTAELERVIADCWSDIRALKFDKLPERDDKDRCARCEYDSICWGG
ncbi:MAG: ATP-dependent DNA helicase [Candidatus Omnitrophota bacterium]|jgi:DNA helicase-2/ATP-dependent DNA helicase PcrA